jgi:hypothetical protein
MTTIDCVRVGFEIMKSMEEEKKTEGCVSVLSTL